MTNADYKLAEDEYEYAQRRVMYLSNLYYTVLDILKNDVNTVNKLNKRVPVCTDYVHRNHNFNSPCYDDFYYSGVKAHLSNIDTFEIIVSNFLCDNRSKDIIEALPKGAGWQEDNWYTRKDIPQLLRVIKKLRRDADVRLEKSRAAYEAADAERKKTGLKKDPLYDLKRLLSLASSDYYNVNEIKDYLKSKGIEVD